MRTTLTLLLAFLADAPALAQELGKPVRLEAAGKAIDTEIGHAYPYVYDFDRDGKRDLLVGQFGGGKMKIYLNLGTNAAPRFGEAAWLEAEGRVVTTPAG